MKITKPLYLEEKKINDLLKLIEVHLSDSKIVQLESSKRISKQTRQLSGRYIIWLEGIKKQDFTGLTNLLHALHAPQQILEAQTKHFQAIRQGIGVKAEQEKIEYRLYLHGKKELTQADTYVGWKWDLAGNVQKSEYQFHFFPETALGETPLDFVPVFLKSTIEALLQNDLLQQSSGFWLRYNAIGQINQLDISFPWNPNITDLPPIQLLLNHFNLSSEEKSILSKLPIRHLGFKIGEASPVLTFYTSTTFGGLIPKNQLELEKYILKGAQQDAVEMIPLIQKPSTKSSSQKEFSIGSFYDGSIPIWEKVLGKGMHYHAGFFEEDWNGDNASADEAKAKAVRTLYRHIPRKSRLYDIGCGWGGPLAMLNKEQECYGLGITPSRSQYQYVAQMGLPIRYGDAEQTLIPGQFDVALLLESFSHFQDKLTFLKRLRKQAKRLVMRVNCQDYAANSTNFGNSMHMISSQELEYMLHLAGWKIRYWGDKRLQGLPSVKVWNQRLKNIEPTPDKQIETLRAWSTRVLQYLEEWGHNNPLIEVMAES